MRIRSLRTRLTILVTIVTVPILVAVAFFLTTQAADRLDESANEQIRLANSSLKGNVSIWVTANTRVVQQMVAQPDIISMDPAQQKPVLVSTAKAYPYLFLVQTTNLDGINVARNDNNALQNYSDRKWFQGAKSGNAVTIEALVSRTTGKPALNMSAPIKDASGNIIGVGAVVSELDDITQQVQVSKVGRTGVAYVVGSDNRVIAHPDRAFSNELRDLSTYPPVAELRKGVSGHTSFTDDQGIRWHAYLDKLENGWGIIVQQQDSELLNTVQTFQIISWATILLGGVVMLALVGFAVQRSFRPIAALTDAATAITAGDLTRTAPVISEDEIGVLARAFNRMTSELRDLINSLEARVEGRTAQLEAATEVSRAASSILDPTQLMQQMVDLVCERFGYYYAAIFLLDEEGRFAVLRAGRGEPGRSMIERGHKFDTLDSSQSMVGWVCVNQQARIALDVGQEAVRFANPLLLGTRSEIALPLKIGDHVLGVLDVQSIEVSAFDESSIATLQGMADQIAVALENARLFSQAQASVEENERLVSQIQKSLQETTTLYKVGQAIATAPDIGSIFQAIVDNGLQPEIELCLLVLFDEFKTSTPQRVEIGQIWTRGNSTGATSIKNSLRAGSHFEFERFPLHELLTNDPAGIILTQKEADVALWKHLPGLEAIACVPLYTGTRWIGALGLGVCHELALSQDSLRRYQSIASSAAVAIDNRRLFESAQASLQELSTLYRAVTREAWAKTLETKPRLTEFEYAPVELADSTGAKLHVPLVLRGQEIGIVELASEKRTAWTDQERALVEAIVTQAALALDSARLFDETQRLAGRERLINEITARIRASTSVSGILQTAARELAQAMNIPHAVARIQPQAVETPDSRSGKVAGVTKGGG